MTSITRFIGRRELLSELGISKATLLRWTATRGFPKPVPGSGRCRIYRRSEIEGWLLQERD